MIHYFNQHKMYFSESQISMAVGMAKLGVDYRRILMAVTLDRQLEKETHPFEVYLEEHNLKSSVDKPKQIDL